jgi:transcriptional regulator with XRE-family HTH domain
MMDNASRIKLEREKKGFSQRGIANKTGLTQTTILRLQKGNNTNLETLIKVARAIGLNPKVEFEAV